MKPQPRVTLHLLGSPRLERAGQRVEVDTRKAIALMAYLALTRERQGRDKLAALLWPEADDESARGALRRTLSVLRAALGDRWLRVDRTSVGLEPDGTCIDLVALEAAVRAPDVATLRGAAELARGSFLAGFTLRDSPDFDDWRAPRASAVERSVAGVLDLLAAAADAGGDTAGAVAAASRRVDLDPLDEPAQRRLMALLARSGDRGGAIRRYRACVAVLERELGVAPLAETTELYEAIRDARVEPDRGPVATPPPEIAASGPPPPPPAPERLPHVGRDAEVAAVLDCYASVSVDGRVAVVTG